MTRPSSSPTFSGAVLAGGKSSRMGRNKALLRIDGEPLWQRQLRVLHEAGAKPVVLVQAPRQRMLTRAKGVRIIRDTVLHAGPLAGLHAALSSLHPASRGPARERRDSAPGPSHLAILAVDLPRLSAAWFVRLARHCSATAGAVVRTPRGYEPLAAIYPAPALAAATAALAAGDHSLQDFIETLVRAKRLKVLKVPPAFRPQLANWNSPADLRR